MQGKKKTRRSRLWNHTVKAMAAVVVFCTVYALVLPAITKAGDPICGLAEHAHSETCYRNYQMIPQCPAASSDMAVLHQHGEACYDEYGSLACPLEEVAEHIHSELCWVEENTLICLLDEIPAHTHGDECLTRTEELTCTEPEQQPHTHSEACADAQGNRICGLEETEGHTHGQDCYTVTEEMTCTMVETGGHSHDETCYGMRPKLVCDLEQIGVHTHNDTCLNEQGTLVCGITPAVPHDHEADCFRREEYDQPQLICTEPEHSHSAACYPQEEELPQPNDGSICGMGLHIHGETCFDENGDLTCTLAEHTHSEPCFVANYDPNADLETQETWEKSIENVKLSGNWARDVLAVAESQLGYRESDRNVKLWEDGSLKGYTRYGAWYGVPHGDWCAMFVSFCVRYGGAAEVPTDSVCNTYIEKLQEVDLYREADYLPKPGDIVFFDWERTGGEVTDVDHAGIVAEVIRDENGNPIEIRTIEGNWDNCVMQRTHSLESPTIIGYGQMPFGPAKTCLCEEDHNHTARCYGSSIFYSDDTLQAQLIVSGVELPEGLTMTVTAVTEELDPYRYGSMAAALELATEESPFFVGDAGFYHVTLLSGGEVYELPAGAKAVVDVTFTQRVFDPAEVAAGSGLYTYLLAPGEPISLFTGEIIETYETQQAIGESYENAVQGLTGVRLTLNNANDFAVMLASTTQTGTFWTRVTDKSQLTADGTYMIVSAEGNYALNGSTTLRSNHTAVQLETVKGHTAYYTIRTRSGSVDNNVYWTITPNGTSFVVRNQATANYLAPNNGGILTSDKVVTNSSANLSFTYYTPENCWRIANGRNYLHSEGTGNFDVTTGSDATYNNESLYFGRDMLIFKLSDVTELEIPEDVGVFEDENNDNVPDKPNYDPIIQPSNQLTGDTVMVNPDDSALNVPGEYYSDKATSNIEKKFDLDDYEKNLENDGKILTDKSVIYGDDDYDAFESYAPNTFGITLSTLGQEYKIPYQDKVRTPIDVVFVLDVSGSMTTNTADGGAAGSSASRAQDMVKAVNYAIGQIMADHEANRVGVVVYATGAWKMLPLDRYTADNNDFLISQPIDRDGQNGTADKTIHYVVTSNSLKNDDGVSFANLGSNFNQGYGTYTQAGIALGGETFADIGDDTTYTAYFGEGDEQRDYTVPRQPVIILLSDGEPTHATNNYMDPVSGPHYGDGQGTSTNARGIMGYNVILTANYVKRMVGIQYQKKALFYTVGMGISESASTPLHGGDTSDTYKRAVLNPTAENVQVLQSNMTGGSAVNTQLKELLQGSFTDQSVGVTYYWPDPWTGVPHTRLPVLSTNPYADDYAYADRAKFGDLTAADLQEFFMDVVNASYSETPYGFILHKSSSVVIEDQIGEGMCVKGYPILRYAGKNHEPINAIVANDTVQYVYSGTFTHPYREDITYDISEIGVTIETDDNGNQTVRMFVPDTALPVYTPELIGQQFYYEALPVRLIYQVGLTEKSEQEVLALNKTGGTKTFYTNRWENGGGQSVSNLYPSLENPFYYGDENGVIRYHEHTDPKPDGTNVTDTLKYIVDCSKQQEIYEDGHEVTKVVHRLGNNGKLVFEVELPEIDIPVEKKWAGGAKPNGDTQVELMLYQVKPTDTGAEEVIYQKSVILSAETGWAGVFEDMPILTEGYYAIAEKVPEGFHPQYSGQTKTLVIDNKNVLVAVVDTSDAAAIQVTLVTNIPAVQLPETGGIGVGVYYALGLLLIAAAIVYITGNGSLRRKEVQ